MAGTDELSARLYAELKRLARSARARLSPGQTLQPTALAHEAYLKLRQAGEDRKWTSEGEFLSAVARACWNAIVDEVRRKGRDKRGGGAAPVHLSVSLADPSWRDPVAVLAFDQALRRLEEEHGLRKRQVAELRLVADLSVPEIAAALEVSGPTVERDWRFAKARLRSWLEESP